MSHQAERSHEIPLKPLATSLEDMARAIYSYDGFTCEAALQDFSHIKRRPPPTKSPTKQQGFKDNAMKKQRMYQEVIERMCQKAIEHAIQAAGVNADYINKLLAESRGYMQLRNEALQSALQKNWGELSENEIRAWQQAYEEARAVLYKRNQR